MVANPSAIGEWSIKIERAQRSGGMMFKVSAVGETVESDVLTVALDELVDKLFQRRKSLSKAAEFLHDDGRARLRALLEALGPVPERDR